MSIQDARGNNDDTDNKKKNINYSGYDGLSRTIHYTHKEKWNYMKTNSGIQAGMMVKKNHRLHHLRTKTAT